MENSTFLTQFHYSPYSMPILAEFGCDPGQVVPHTRWTVLQLKDHLSPYLSHGYEMRALGGLSRVSMPGCYAIRTLCILPYPWVLDTENRDKFGGFSDTNWPTRVLFSSSCLSLFTGHYGPGW